MNDSITRHLVIRGRVQGVGYRAGMMREALRLGVTGWVRNRLDGSVEAVVCGPSHAVEALIVWAQRGPTMARVDDVQLQPATGTYTRFEQRPTV